MKIYQDLLKTYPGRPEPYNNLAALYAEQGNLDAAKTTLEKGIQTSPVYGTIYKNLGMIYAQIARNSYGKALQLGTRPTLGACPSRCAGPGRHHCRSRVRTDRADPDGLMRAASRA